MALAAMTVALTTACSGSGAPDAPSSAAAAGAVGAAAATSQVAELQAALTALLVERTYLVAAATDAVDASDGQLDAPDAAAALAALDDGSVALADVLGATYQEARDPLLEVLRREDALLAEHAVALATGDAAATATARRGLAMAHAELARTVRRAVPTLDAPQVAERLAFDVQAQLPPRSYEPLHDTAVEAAVTARLLAAGIAADRRLGSPSTDAARLRADVTGLLTEHVALVGALARELRTPGPRSVSARAALQINAEGLASLLGDSYPAAEVLFLRSWTAHLTRLERYAAARAAGSSAEAGLVRAYPAELGRLLAEHVRGLPAQSSRTELEPALTALLDAVDALAEGEAGAAKQLRAAGAAVLPAAALVSGAMAEDLRLS